MKQLTRATIEGQSAIQKCRVEPGKRFTLALPAGAIVIGLGVEMGGIQPELYMLFQYPTDREEKEERTFSFYPVNVALPAGTIVIDLVGVPGKIEGAFYQMAFVELPASEAVSGHQEGPQNGLITGNFDRPEEKPDEDPETDES